MTPALATALLWLAFGGAHVGLATRSIRGGLVGRLGERGFFWGYSLLSAALFTGLVVYYADHRFEGHPGIGLGAVPVARAVLLGISFIGLGLAAAGLVRYASLPVALFGQPIRSPRGLERITRHPFFGGIGLFALAHAMLASALAGTVFFGGLAALGFVGAAHQDAKHLRRRAAYAAYLSETSILPFAAIAGGRQRLVSGELPWKSIAFGLAAAVALRFVHGSIWEHHGLHVAAGVLAGAVAATVSAYARARRS
jgi:uncharacterized membrane protein